MSKIKNFIFGTAGFAKEVDWLISEILASGMEDYSPDFFVGEDSNPMVGKQINSKRVISELEFFKNFSEEPINCFIAVANPIIRRKIYENIILKVKNSNFPNLIHPNVLYDKRGEKILLGYGNIICAGVIITTDVHIDNFVHINLNSTIGHDCIINSFVTISPGVNISGNVTIEENVYIGTGVVLLERLKIVTNCVLGAGAVVNKSIEESGTYVGVPAKRIK